MSVSLRFRLCPDDPGPETTLGQAHGLIHGDLPLRERLARDRPRCGVRRSLGAGEQRSGRKHQRQQGYQGDRSCLHNPGKIALSA